MPIQVALCSFDQSLRCSVGGETHHMSPVWKKNISDTASLMTYSPALDNFPCVRTHATHYVNGMPSGGFSPIL